MYFRGAFAEIRKVAKWLKRGYDIGKKNRRRAEDEEDPLGGGTGSGAFRLQLD